jgi:hypothetical protein
MQEEELRYKLCMVSRLQCWQASYKHPLPCSVPHTQRAEQLMLVASHLWLNRKREWNSSLKSPP